MCSLTSNPLADEGFAQLRRAGEKNPEHRLAQLAQQDSVSAAQGLEKQLRVISSWRHHADLRTVRKCRIGRHRVYVQGRHLDCRYRICYIKVFKREETDPEEDQRFQARILRALAEQDERLLPGGASAP